MLRRYELGTAHSNIFCIIENDANFLLDKCQLSANMCIISNGEEWCTSYPNLSRSYQDTLSGERSTTTLLVTLALSK